MSDLDDRDFAIAAPYVQKIAELQATIERQAESIIEWELHCDAVKTELSVAHAREVELKEVLREFIRAGFGESTDFAIQVPAYQNAHRIISNSTEHTEKWLAEHDANTLECRPKSSKRLSR